MTFSSLGTSRWTPFTYALGMAGLGLLSLPGCTDQQLRDIGWFITLAFVVGMAMAVGYVYVVAAAASRLARGNPSMTLGVACLVIGGIQALGSLGATTNLNKDQSPGSLIFSFLFGGAYCAVGFLSVKGFIEKAKQDSNSGTGPSQ